ncbi:helix-turn-helix domain-containing protein [Streptosporangiaceae bacterium NEAU-GS5]|nr:helix-turn-helix domain-containing protein [Streptosporangiaceae bacterium NEAU-GS5]
MSITRCSPYERKFFQRTLYPGSYAPPPRGVNRRSRATSRRGTRHNGRVESSEFVQSLARGLAVIRAFDATTPELTLSEVARKTGLTRAAARRFLLTLAELGYVHSDGRLFSLSPRVLDLGYAYLSGLSLPEIALPHLERLVADVHESASVSVLDDTDIVYVARVPTTRIMRVTIAIGTRFPAHATSMGRVLLAWNSGLDDYLARAELAQLTSRTVTAPDALRVELDKVRAQGWALVDQELEEGLRSIAAPIRDRTGQVVAAVNLSSHASRTTLEAARRNLLPPLLATAERIQTDLHGVAKPARHVR